MKFLYNGIALPPLPEWDKAAYPYAVMIYNPDGFNHYRYFLYCYEQRPEWKKSYGAWAIRIEGGYLYSYHTGEDTDNWTDFGSGTNPYAISGDKARWTNVDVLNAEDGSVFFAASYPIDAETGEEITIYEPNPDPVPKLSPSEFKGTNGGSTLGYVKIEYSQVYDSSSDTLFFKIDSIWAKATKYTGEYNFQGKVTMAYGQDSVYIDLLSWKESNANNEC